MRVSLLLAGGDGRRFGRRDKLLEDFRGVPILAHALRAAQAATRRTIVVLPPGFARRRAFVRRWPGLVVRTAPDARAGIGASLTEGLRALRPIDREMLVFLADMPLAGAPRLRLRAGQDAARPVTRGIPGHPMLVRVAAARGRQIAADKGLGAALDRTRLAMVGGGPGNVLDVDTPAALRRLRHRTTRKERRC